MAHHDWARKIFQVLRRLENATLNFVLANNRAILLPYLSYPESTMGPQWPDSEKNFKKEVFRWLENAIFEVGFATTVFQKRAMLLTFWAEYPKGVFDIKSKT